METAICPSSLLWSQLGHAALLALVLLLIGALAVALDLAAHRAGRLGAGRLTVWLLKSAAGFFLVLDLVVVLAVAVVFARPAVASCLSVLLQ